MAKQPTVGQVIRHNRKKVEKRRVMVSLSQAGYNALLKLAEQEPDMGASRIISEALRFAFEVDMFKPMREFRNELRIERGSPEVSAPEGVHRPVAIDKKQWCVKYGGVCDGVNCRYDKYEVTMMGRVVKNQRSEPIRTMPENEDDFCKLILGGFSTLSEAEAAFLNQEEEPEL